MRLKIYGDQERHTSMNGLPESMSTSLRNLRSGSRARACCVVSRDGPNAVGVCVEPFVHFCATTLTNILTSERMRPRYRR